MATYHQFPSNPTHEFGLLEFEAVVEHPKYIYNLHHLSLQRYYEGPQIVQKLLDLRVVPGSIFNFRTWTSRPVLSIARLQVMHSTSYGLEAQRDPMPVIIKNRRHDPYLSPRLYNPTIFPSAIKLQEHLSTEHQILPTRRLSGISMRTNKAILISYETSKLAVSIFGTVFLTVAIIIGVIAGVLTSKFEVGIAVTSALVAIMAVVQSFYR